MGRNGSGKSSLLWALQGSGKRRGGVVSIDGRDPAALDDAERRTLVGLVPQNAADLLYLETVADELATSGATAPTSSGWSRASTATPIPATCRRVNASRSR